MTVFDASALLAYLSDEPGAAEIKSRILLGSVCGAANWSEVAQKVQSAGGSWSEARTLLLRLGLSVEAITVDDAEAAALLWAKGSGLSLGDRLCLALGARLDSDILTCDKHWKGMPGVVVVR